MQDQYKFSIWIVTPDNYIHSQCFSEVALSLSCALNNIGKPTKIVTKKSEIQGTPIILGANILAQSNDFDIPTDSIIYNLEQVDINSSWINGQYIKLLQQYNVWDYSKQNIVKLNNLGIDNIILCPIGYVNELSVITDSEIKDIDILFIGSMNSRRQVILDILQNKNYKVVTAFGCYGKERDDLIARAKINLNLHFYDAKILEIVRISYLLANKKFVISETSADQLEYSNLAGGVVFTTYDRIVSKCEEFLNNEDARNKVANKGFEIFSNYDLNKYVSNALDKTHATA